MDYQQQQRLRSVAMLADQARQELDAATSRRSPLGLSRHDLARYSLARAIMAWSRGRLLADAPHEREISLAYAKAHGLPEPIRPSAFYACDKVLQRDMLAGQPPSLGGSSY